jgi:hypothetical protein
MNDLVYKLNLPPLTDILLDGVAETLFKDTTKSAHRNYHPAELLKKEWLAWQNVEWNFVNFFYKDNATGIIHSDGPASWAINWIHQGHGVLKFWYPQPEEILPASVDELNNIRYVYDINRPADKEYTMYPGAYLVNTSLPHLPSGYNNRYAFSLRSYTRPTPPWSAIFEKFKHLII